MDIYASDEEKAEAIKQWWRDNGRSVVAGVILGGAAIFGLRYWTTHQDVQAQNASVLYQQAAIQMNQSEYEQAQSTVSQLTEEYASTAYAVFAALELAQVAIKKNELNKAEEQLNWVIDNAKLSAHRDLARLRLVQIHLQQDNYAVANDLIQNSETAAFSSLFAELEGDIALAQGKADDALVAYQRAVASMTIGDPRQQLLQLKLDDVAVAHEG
jgi:predicted negative regulator of RcsB-dependent stress response